MKIKWSGFGVVAGSGKINGHVASRNRAGAYARTKVTPVNPNTSAQQAARGLLGGLSSFWRGLTQAQIAAWNSAVEGFAKTDIFGDLRNPTGKNLFTRLNINLSNIGASMIATPPQPAAVHNPIVTAVDIFVGIGTYDITFSGDDIDMDYLVLATPSLSPGVSFVKSEYRVLGSVAGGGGSPFDFSALYLAKFGAPAVDSKVFAGLQAINNTTGQAGQLSSLPTIAQV